MASPLGQDDLSNGLELRKFAVLFDAKPPKMIAACPRGRETAKEEFQEKFISDRRGPRWQGQPVAKVGASFGGNHVGVPNTRAIPGAFGGCNQPFRREPPEGGINLAVALVPEVGHRLPQFAANIVARHGLEAQQSKKGVRRISLAFHIFKIYFADASVNTIRTAGCWRGHANRAAGGCYAMFKGMRGFARKSLGTLPPGSGSSIWFWA